jgi:hypothetical protein
MIWASKVIRSNIANTSFSSSEVGSPTRSIPQDGLDGASDQGGLEEDAAVTRAGSVRRFLSAAAGRVRAAFLGSDEPGWDRPREPLNRHLSRWR